MLIYECKVQRFISVLRRHQYSVKTARLNRVRSKLDGPGEWKLRLFALEYRPFKKSSARIRLSLTLERTAEIDNRFLSQFGR